MIDISVINNDVVHHDKYCHVTQNVPTHCAPDCKQCHKEKISRYVMLNSNTFIFEATVNYHELQLYNTPLLSVG